MPIFVVRSGAFRLANYFGCAKYRLSMDFYRVYPPNRLPPATRKSACKEVTTVTRFDL